MAYKTITQKEKQHIELFLKEVFIININQEIKNGAVKIKKQTNLKLPDSIIAATAAFLKIPLVTADKHFKSLQDFELILYEQ